MSSRSWATVDRWARRWRFWTRRPASSSQALARSAHASTRVRACRLAAVTVSFIWLSAASTAGEMSASSSAVSVTGPEFLNSWEMPAEANMAVGESCTCATGTACGWQPAARSVRAACRSR